MEDVVVTETSLPARMGVYTERRGSALCRTGRIWRFWRLAVYSHAIAHTNCVTEGPNGVHVLTTPKEAPTVCPNKVGDFSEKYSRRGRFSMRV